MAITSATTPHKLDALDRLMKAQVRAMSGAHRGARGWAHPDLIVVDFFSGPGGYLFDGVWRPGSPLICLAQLETLGVGYELWLCEQDPAMLASLTAHVERAAPRGGRVEILAGDNRHTIPGLAADFRRRIRRPAFGVFMADPQGTYFDPEPMRTLLAAFPSKLVDCLIYLFANAYRRGNARWEATHGHRDVRADLGAVGKEYAWIRANGDGRMGGTFAILSNWGKYPPHKEFVRLDSAEGERAVDRLFLRRAEWTERFLGHQSMLPLDELLPTNGHTEPTPSTSGTPDSSPSAPRSSGEPPVDANGADDEPLETPTTSDTPPGEDSTCPTT